MGQVPNQKIKIISHGSELNGGYMGSVLSTEL